MSQAQCAMIIFFKNNVIVFQRSFAVVATKKKLNETRNYRTLKHRQDCDLSL